jgi:hypothetical protein
VKVPVTIAYKWWETSFYGSSYKEDQFQLNRHLPVSVPVRMGNIKPGTAHYFNGQEFSGFEFLQ